MLHCYVEYTAMEETTTPRATHDRNALTNVYEMKKNWEIHDLRGAEGSQK